MAVVQGAELQDVIVDGGESAKSLNRPGIERLLALVNARAVDAVIISELDRLTRSVKDLAELLERFQKRGVSLVSVAESLDTGSAAGRLVMNIMTVVSQWEREAIGERTRDVLRHKRAKGEVYSRVTPFGFRREGDRLTVVHDEVTTVHAIRERQRAGWSLRKIASELNRAGAATKNGGRQWCASTVRQILSNTIYQEVTA